MNLKDKGLGDLLLVVTYAIVLFLGLSNLDKLLGAAGFVVGVLMPIILAVCIAYVINLPMMLVEARLFAPLWRRAPRLAKAKRGISLLTAIALVAAVLVALVMFVVPQIAQSASVLARQIPTFVGKIGEAVSGLLAGYDLTNTIWQRITENWRDIATTVTNFISSTVPQIFSVTMGITSGIINLVLALTLAVYMLLDKERLLSMLRKMCYAFLPTPRAQGLLELGDRANRIFSKFIGGQITEAFILGSLCAIGMWILRMPYALMISVIVAVSALIPILGAYLGVFFGVFIIAMENPIQALGFILFFVLLQQFEGNVIYPRVVGGSIGLRGIWVLGAITVGGSLFGLGGMLVGVPVFAVIYGQVRRTTYRRLAEKGLEDVA